jgi:hypothetical protein
VALTLVLLAVAMSPFFVSATTALASQLAWSSPITLNPAAVPVEALRVVICPSSSQCTAIDNWGELTFNPSSAVTSPPDPVDNGHQLSHLACATTMQCTAVDSDGREVTFDPNAPDTALAADIDGTQGFAALACPSSSLCTAIDSAGREITFNPVSPGTPMPVPLGRRKFSAQSLSCPSSTECVAVGWAEGVGGGQVMVYNPASQGIPEEARITGWTAEGGTEAYVSCPSASECAVVYSRQEITFDPQSVGSPTPVSFSGEGAFKGVSCPSVTQCTAIATPYGGGFRGGEFSPGEVTFDPQDPTRNIAGPTSIFEQNAWDTSLDGISCPTASQCTAIDLYNGRETTFDPTSAGSMPAPTFLDAAESLSDIACPTSTQCVAFGLGEDGPATTNPSGSTSANVPQDDELTFSPSAANAATVTPIPSLRAGYVWGSACPTSTECVATDNNGELVTFNPFGPSSFSSGYDVFKGFSNAFHTIASCPSATQCTVVDEAGQAVTFNPASPGTPKASSVDSPTTYRYGFAVTSLACPSPTQCTVVDTGGREATFNPQAAAVAAPVSVDKGGPLQDVACPSVNQCTAVDERGREVTFDPATPRKAKPASVDAGASIARVACPTTKWCVAVDSSGRAIAGDPQRRTSWAVLPIGGANALTSVACTSTTTCEVIDIVGNAFVGTASPNAQEAANIAAPTVTGRAVQGHVLSVQSGSWTNDPEEYLYLWERCNHSQCAPIPEATTSTYTLSASDVGATVRVQVSAVDSAGTGLTATSLPTKIVAPTNAATILRTSTHAGRATVRIRCVSVIAHACEISLALYGVERVVRDKVVAVSTAENASPTYRVVNFSRTKVRIAAGHTKTANLALNTNGRRLLSKYGRLALSLHLTQSSPELSIKRTVVFVAVPAHR